jgi:hypothetical protein
LVDEIEARRLVDEVEAKRLVEEMRLEEKQRIN